MEAETQKLIEDLVKCIEYGAYSSFCKQECCESQRRVMARAKAILPVKDDALAMRIYKEGQCGACGEPGHVFESCPNTSDSYKVRIGNMRAGKTDAILHQMNFGIAPGFNEQTVLESLRRHAKVVPCADCDSIYHSTGDCVRYAQR